MNRFLAFAFLLTLTACGGQERAPRESQSVVFAIEPAPPRDPSRLGWIATHTAEGKIARFRIELEPEPKGATLPAFVKCRLSREPDSDGSAMLKKLAGSLGGAVPSIGPGIEGVDAPTVILARNLSRGGRGNQVAGLFGTEPPGSWISTKMTFDEAEVFLNLDPIAGYAEFSLKDPGYGPRLLKLFGQLLQGPAVDGIADLTSGKWTENTEAQPLSPDPAPAPQATPDRNAERVAALAERAKPGSPTTDRIKALDNLAKLGPSAVGAADMFIKALEDPHEMVRNAAIRGFASLRPDNATALAAVKPLLSDSYAINQVLAAGALADFGEPDLAVEHLKRHLSGKEASWAAAALSRMGSHAAPAVAALMIMLETRQDPTQGYAACQALAAIGRQASPALSALRKAASDPDRSVSGMAAFAIKQIEGS